MNESVVIVPTYNERENLTRLLERILRVEPALDVLIVDDNSPDGTGAIADEFASTHSAVHTLHRPSKQGLGRAYVAGFKWGLGQGYKYLCQMDADLSHGPEALPAFLEATQRYDLVLGSRYIGGIRVLDWDMTRLLISSFGNWYARVVTGLAFSDLTGGFKCYTRPVLEAIDLDRIRSIGYAFQIEMTWWAVQYGFRVGEIPIIFNGRDHGETKFSRSIAWEAAWTVWKLRLGLIQNGGARRQVAAPS